MSNTDQNTIKARCLTLGRKIKFNMDVQYEQDTSLLSRLSDRVKPRSFSFRSLVF